jgi:D-aminopeptidase
MFRRVSGTPPSGGPRARERGIEIGVLPVGATNSIVDVPGVRVGHATCWHDEPTVARTGVTAIVPAPIDELFRAPMCAGSAVLNGAGELTGAISMAEWGLLEVPVMLTGTTSVGRVYDAVNDALFDAVPEMGVDDVAIPVVGECDDSWLDDARARHVRVEHGRAAIDAASDARPAMGAVGAGAGMIAFGCKAGIGSASRRVERLGAHVGVLVLANFGSVEQLVVNGDPVGRRLAASGFEGGRASLDPAGSCIAVVATDAPLDADTCERLARRAGMGLARTGSIGHHSSGEIFLAFSTTARQPRDPGDPPQRMVLPAHGSWVNELFAAVVEATEEAVLDALFAAGTVVGRDGNTAPGLPWPA